MPPVSILAVSIPPFFRCPISLDLMRDPVTLCTGVTYDRRSIEKWFDEGQKTCPATMQVLENFDLIPNHTLRRLIQEWCVANSSKGVVRIPTPKSPLDVLQVKQMLEDIANCSYKQVENLKRLRVAATESRRNLKCLIEAGTLAALVSFISTHDLNTEIANYAAIEVVSEAVALLLMLPMDEKTRKQLSGSRYLSSLSWLLSRGKIEAKVSAAALLETLVVDSSVKLLASDSRRIFEGLMELISRHSWPSAVKTSLKCLFAISRCRRARIKITEAGFIQVIVELLPGANRGATELILAILETLSSCAEGREVITQHALAIPMIVKNLLVLSDLATERALAVLSTVCLHSPDEALLHAAVNAGAFKKILLLVQLDCGLRIKSMARELLKLLQKVADGCEISTPSYKI